MLRDIYVVLLVSCACRSFAATADSAVSSLSTIFVPLSLNSAGRYTVDVNMSTSEPSSQSFAFEVSTGVGYSMVPGLGCLSCGDVPTFNISESITAKSLGDTANVSFPTGSSGGSLIKEDCSFRTQNGTPWVYNDQTILVVNQTDLPSSSTGLVGLGRNVNGSFDATVFSGYLARNPGLTNLTWGMALNNPYSNSSDGGVLHWTLPQASFYKGKVSTKNATSIPKLSDWAVTLDGWTLATTGTSLAHTTADTLAAIEPYYPNIYIPHGNSRSIFETIPGAELQKPTAANPSFAELWKVPCSTKMNFTVVIGDQTVTLDESILVLSQGGSCYCALQGWTDQTASYIMLGASFISAIYVIFSAGDTSGTIGFALRADASKKHLSPGAIAGIAIGSAAVFALIVVALGFAGWKLYRSGKQAQLDEQLIQQSRLVKEPTSPTHTYSASTPSTSPYTLAFDPVQLSPDGTYTSPSGHLSYSSRSARTPSYTGESQIINVPRDWSSGTSSPPLDSPPVSFMRSNPDSKHRAGAAPMAFVHPMTPPTPPHDVRSFAQIEDPNLPPPDYDEDPRQ